MSTKGSTVKEGKLMGKEAMKECMKEMIFTMQESGI